MGHQPLQRRLLAFAYHLAVQRASLRAPLMAQPNGSVHYLRAYSPRAASVRGPGQLVGRCRCLRPSPIFWVQT